jgi:hypothetical protein
MASYNYTFTSGDTVTPTKLNSARTVSEIVNADIKSDAAIAGTKVAPAFGSQNVSATGSIQSNGTGSSFSQINGGTADGASVRLCRGGSATQNAYLSQFQGSLFIKNNDSGAIVFNTTTSDIERMRMDTNGNVSVGTTTTNFRTTSAHSASDGAWLHGSSTSSYLGLGGYAGATDGAFRLNYERTTGAITFSGGTRDTPVERMRIDNVGNVGIGVAPANNLDVAGSQYLRASTTETRSLDIGWGRTQSGFAHVDLIGDATYTDYGLRILRGNTGANAASQIIHRGTGDLQMTSQEAAPIVFSATNTERMRITADGKVGIGTSSPAQELSVVGDITATAGVSAGTSLYTANFVYVGGVQVIESRKTGWAAATGTATRTTFATSTVTTAQLAERVKALIDDLRSHGLIGN